MLGCKYEVGGTEESIGTGGEHRDALLHTIKSKSHLGSLTSADPVPLEKLDRLRPVEPLQIGDQALRVGRDPKHPLAHRAALHREAADFALPIDYFLICENGTEFRAPVHRFIRDEGKSHTIRITPPVGRDRLGLAGGWVEPGTVELQKDPLRPAEVLRVSRADLTRPVVAEAERLELGAEVVDIPLGGDARVLTRLDRVLFGRQAEGIPSHRMEHIVAAQPVIAGQDVRCGVPFNVADMEAVSARVGKHIEDEVLLRLGSKTWLPGVGGTECVGLQPVLLPAGFKLREGIVLAGQGHLVGTLIRYGIRKYLSRQATRTRIAEDSFGHPKSSQDPRDPDHAGSGRDRHRCHRAGAPS